MVEIKTDNPEARKCIEAMVSHIESSGGILRDPISLSCINNYLLKGDELYINSYDNSLHENNVEMMRLMLELYNITDKISDYKKNSPWIFLKQNPALAGHVLLGRNSAYNAKHLEDASKNSNDSHTVKTFLESRALKLSPVDGGKTPLVIIMPVIDFINHHTSGPQYHPLIENDHAKLVARAANPVEGTTETFACYGPYDALDTAVAYGYADRSSRFTRSIKLDLDMGNIGHIVVNGYTQASPAENLPEKMKDLKFFIPEMVMPESGLLEISHLFIPGPGAPRALRRVLMSLINLLNPSLTIKEAMDFVTLAENRIIKENLDYYHSMERMLNELPQNMKHEYMANVFKEVIEIQLQKIHAYDNIRKKLAA